MFAYIVAAAIAVAGGVNVSACVRLLISVRSSGPLCGSNPDRYSGSKSA